MAEFSYSLDINNLWNESKVEQGTNIEPINLELNHEIFKALTKIDLPFLYRVYASNDVFVFIDATKPSNAPATTTVILNSEVKILYQETPQMISKKALSLKNSESVQNYLLNQKIQIVPNYKGEILVGPNQYFYLKVDGVHKFINFDFKLDCYFMFILYLFALIVIYPVFFAAIKSFMEICCKRISIF
ncbi:MAG: hypothetical protein NTV77_02905 [Candidatus Azambacteria bacterium]|nr:hypothetical protein [Candidatus Azambacteria bacterium]